MTIPAQPASLTAASSMPWLARVESQIDSGYLSMKGSTWWGGA